MMTEHKAWDWSKNKDGHWLEPSEDSYYLVEGWEARGYESFLDLGCGLGRHALQFSRAGFETKAFDLSPEAIRSVSEKAAEEGLSVDARCGDMTELPYGEASFDCLLAYHVISHTDTPGIKKVVDEIARVLKPSGEFYLSLCSKKAGSFGESGFPRIDENTVRKIEDGPENGIPHFFADEPIIDKLFRGLSIVSLKHIQDLVVQGSAYGSWHYFILGGKG
jgi:SAM-dependent methyltransferase